MTTSTTTAAYSAASQTASTGSVPIITIGGSVAGTGYNFANASYTGNYSNTYSNTTSSGNLKVHGDAEFSGDIKFQGKSLTRALEQIEQRLAILHPNPELESRWDELKELAIRYKALEAEIIEKEKIWATLKK